MPCFFNIKTPFFFSPFLYLKKYYEYAQIIEGQHLIDEHPWSFSMKRPICLIKIHFKSIYLYISIYGVFININT